MVQRSHPSHTPRGRSAYSFLPPCTWRCAWWAQSTRVSHNTPPNIYAFSAPVLFACTDGDPALSCPFTVRLCSTMGWWWEEHIEGHCLSRQNSLHVRKMLLEPILEMKLLIILLHSIPLGLIKGDSGFLFASAIAPDKRPGNFHPSALGKSGNCHFGKGLTKSQAGRTLETFAKSLQDGWNTSCPREAFLLHLFTSNKTHLWLSLGCGIFNKRRYSTPAEEIRIVHLEQAASKRTGDMNGILFRTEMGKTSSEGEFGQIWGREQESVTWVVEVAVLA